MNAHVYPVYICPWYLSALCFTPKASYLYDYWYFYLFVLMSMCLWYTDFNMLHVYAYTNNWYSACYDITFLTHSVNQFNMLKK